MQITNQVSSKGRVAGRMAVVLLIATIAVLYSAFYLRTLSKWWYADDPLHFHYVLAIANPLDIFTRPAVLLDTGAGNALVPVQLLSYWVDAHLFGAQPLTAYVHNLVVFVATTVALYGVLWQWTRRWSIAAGTTVLWMVLPSTLAVHQYTSTRHYMEGLLFALLMVLVTQRGVQRSERIGWGWTLLIASLGLLSMLCKEVYATTVPTYLFLVGWHRRRYSLMGAALGLTAIYAAYRLAFLGANLSYTMPLLGPQEFLQFLGVLPYAFTANPVGYLFYGGVVAVSVRWFLRDWRMALGPTVLCLALIAASILAVYPVAEGLLLTYREPETWYRVPFLINTVLLLYGTYALAKTFEPAMVVTALILALCLVLPNTEFARLQWTHTMAQAETEGKFYLEEPDKLLYSEEEAVWFIIGVHRLYNVAQPHYVHKYFVKDPDAERLLQNFGTIWRYKEGDYETDPELYEKLVRMNTEGQSSPAE